MLTEIVAVQQAASSLKALHSNLRTITPVHGLRHLVVCDAGPSFKSLARLLPLFKALETLCLYNCSKQDKMPYYSKHADVRFPELHLGGMTVLRSLELDTVLPRSIQLHETCDLHITLTGRLIP